MASRLIVSALKFLRHELLRRILKNSGYLFSATGLGAAMSMIQSILAARLLGVAGFGLLGTITMFVSVINKLASFRMTELVIKYIGHYTETKEPQRAAAVFKLACLSEAGASIFAFAMVVFLAPIGAQYFAKDLQTAPWFIFYGSIVLANLVSESSTGLLQIYDRFRPIAVVNILQSALILALTWAAYLMNGGLLEVLAVYLIGKVFGAAGLAFMALNQAKNQWGREWWKSPLHLLRNELRELAGFAFSTNLSASISLVTKDSELLWVSFFRNPTETGYYKLALSLANVLQLPVEPLPQATFPELSRQAARKNWANMRLIMRQGSLLAFSYSAVATLALILVGKPLISLVYTSAYLPAYPALLLLLLGYLVSNTIYWRRPALLALGRPDYPTKINLALAALKTLGILFLVPTYGYLASAALLAAFYWSTSLLSLAIIRTLLPRPVEG